MSEQSDQVEAQARQREEAQRATLAKLRAKAPPKLELVRKVEGELLSFEFVSVGNLRYDELLTLCPPTTKQTADGASYDQAKFAPKLLAEVCREPRLSEAEWAELWKSPDWSRGEMSELFFAAVNLCNSGQGLAPLERG